MTIEEQEETEIVSSRLGTKNYWDSVYSRDLDNFNEFGDIGEIWFGEESERLIVEWVLENDYAFDTRILEIGCGNAHLLLNLASEGFTNLTGTDYSEKAIDLARKLCTESPYDVTLIVDDILNTQIDSKCDIVIDKGTFDAISLAPSNSSDSSVADPAEDAIIGGKRDESVIKKYVNTVSGYLQDHGLFLITSCNWTVEELTRHFTPKLRLHTDLSESNSKPAFSFGGVVGQTTVTAVFVRNE